jgi:hypothetical protein
LTYEDSTFTAANRFLLVKTFLSAASQHPKHKEAVLRLCEFVSTLMFPVSDELVLPGLTLTHASGAALLAADLTGFLRSEHEHQLARTLAYEALQYPIKLPVLALNNAFDYAVVDHNLAALAGISVVMADGESRNPFYESARKRIAEYLGSTDLESLTAPTRQYIEAAQHYLSRDSYLSSPFEYLTPGDPTYRLLLRRRLEGTALAEYLKVDLSLIAPDPSLGGPFPEGTSVGL